MLALSTGMLAFLMRMLALWMRMLAFSTGMLAFLMRMLASPNISCNVTFNFPNFEPLIWFDVYE
jgi:hypothetical protein